MPEVLTKHPDAALSVARSSGAKCGGGEPQKILTKCPKERFCSFPGGELCVYGLPEVGQMTQISTSELAALVCKPAEKKGVLTMGLDGGAGGLVLALAIGLALGRFIRRSRGAPRSR